MSSVPLTDDQPTVPLWPTAGQSLGYGRNATYAAAARGEIPTLDVGRLKRVPTAWLRRTLQLDEAA
jgi:hypothetical protein